MMTGTSDAQARDDIDEQYDRIRRMSDTWLTEDLKPYDRVRAALMAPRALLYVGRADLALRLLKHLSEDVFPQTPLYRHHYIVLANMAYCYNALGDQSGDSKCYQEAITLLHRIRRIQRAREEAEDDEAAYGSWHAVDLAYAYYRLGDSERSQKALREAANFDRQFEELIPWFSKLHPDLASELARVHEELKPVRDEDF
jgi:tetratricopeptide (TPR) repeat protein